MASGQAGTSLPVGHYRSEKVRFFISTFQNPDSSYVQKAASKAGNLLVHYSLIFAWSLRLTPKKFTLRTNLFRLLTVALVFNTEFIEGLSSRARAQLNRDTMTELWGTIKSNLPQE